MECIAEINGSLSFETLRCGSVINIRQCVVNQGLMMTLFLSEEPMTSTAR